MGGQSSRRDDQAGQGSGVLGKYCPQRGIGGGHHVLDHIPLQRLGLGSGLPDRLQERDSLQDKGHGQHHVTDDEPFGRLRVDKFLDAVRDRYGTAGHEKPERGEQRPHVRFPAMAERVSAVGRPACPPVGDHQEDLVAGVRPRMRRLGHERRRSGHHGGGRLRHGDQDVGGEGHQHRGDALRCAGAAQQRHRHERLTGSAGSSPRSPPVPEPARRPARAPSTTLNTIRRPSERGEIPDRSGGGQPGTSLGVPATTANRSAIPARVAVCSLAAGTGVPPGTGRSRVAVALATTVGR